MKYLIYTFLPYIYFCSTIFEWIPISDYETKDITFMSTQDYYIFGYNYSKIHKFAKPSFVFKINSKYYNHRYYYYIYKSFDQIKLVDNEKFINYLHNGTFTSEHIYNSSNYAKNNTEEYYIVIQQEKIMNETARFTIFPYKPKIDIYSFIGAIIIGIGLSLPNIILQIVRRCKNQMAASWFTFVMNIICHFAYGSIICEILKFTGYGTFLVTEIIGGFYLAICMLCLLIALCGGPKSYYSVLYNLCKI